MLISNAWTYLQARLNLSEERGQTLTEYALILVLIAIAAVGIMATLGDTIDGVFSDANDELGGAAE
jgi:Flp pilus assembly pilin Flp